MNYGELGRVRARKLYHEGFKTLIDIQKATIEQLSAVPLLGPELAKKIQAQANIILNGEESDENVSGKRTALAKKQTRKRKNQYISTPNDKEPEGLRETKTEEITKSPKPAHSLMLS